MSDNQFSIIKIGGNIEFTTTTGGMKMQREHWKRALAGALSVVMLAGLCSCGGGGQTGPGSKEGDDGNQTVVTMTYWNSESTVRSLLDLIDEKLPDIKLEFNFVANTAYGTTTRTKLLGGNGDDIIGFPNDAIPELARQGVLEDLTDLVKDFDLEEENYVDGRVYGVPMATWYEGIYYNKEIFEENNIAVPTTYDELLDVCEKLQSIGIKPFVIGAGTASTLLKNFLGYAQAEYMLQDEGKDFNVKFAKGEAKMADCLTPYVEQWKEIVTRGHINSNMLGIDENQAPDEFVTGVAAMWPSGTWSYNSIKQKNINLEFGLMPYLGSTPEHTSLVGTTGGGYCLNAKSKNKEAAYRVLEVIASPEGQKALCEGNPGSSSQRKGVEAELPEEYALVQETIDEGRVMCSWIYWVGNGAFDGLSKALQAIVADPSRTDVKEQLEKVDKQVESYLKSQE